MNSSNWDHYRSFLAVLRTGSLSAAARDLDLTQPTVGRHIEALEKSFGYPLFTRNPQGLAPSEAAMALRPYAETIASTISALQRHASEELGAVRGTVRITASDVIGAEVLPPILARLREIHPGLVLEVSLSDALEDILMRKADIAVRMASPRQGALLSRHIGGIPLGLFAHRGYIERCGMPKDAADLENHSMIGFDQHSAYVRTAAKTIRSLLPDFPDLETVKWTYRTDSNLGQLGAIRAGIGIGFCQIGIARRDPDLVHVLADEFRLPLDTWLVMHEDLKLLPRYRAVFDILVEGLLDYARSVRGETGL
jgi:DNA-binding transcriptional LysR family regulator